MYIQGEGMKADAAKGFDLIRKSAELGHLPAMLNLGQLYQAGTGTVKNPKEALRWSQRAMEKGEPNSPLYVADFYLKGIGVAKDSQGYRRSEVVCQGEKHAGDVCNEHFSTTRASSPRGTTVKPCNGIEKRRPLGINCQLTIRHTWVERCDRTD